MNTFSRVFLNAKEEKELLQGFPWVFDNEISHIKYRENCADENSAWLQKSLADSEIKDGEIVEVFTKAGGFIGTGIINTKSKITIRLIGRIKYTARPLRRLNFLQACICGSGLYSGIYLRALLHG